MVMTVVISLVRLILAMTMDMIIACVGGVKVLLSTDTLFTWTRFNNLGGRK